MHISLPATGGLLRSEEPRNRFREDALIATLVVTRARNANQLKSLTDCRGLKDKEVREQVPPGIRPGPHTDRLDPGNSTREHVSQCAALIGRWLRMYEGGD